MTSSSARSDEYLPQELPKYTYVPGITPHPVSDPCGHAYGQTRPRASGNLLAGMTLFNHGYYWEAHEAWEAEWLAAGRSGSRADMIKGLIKLAACGVKCLERNPAGAIRHARRAGELLQRSTDSNFSPVQTQQVQAVLAFAQRLTVAPLLATTDQQQQTSHGGVPVLGRLPELTLPASDDSSVSR